MSGIRPVRRPGLVLAAGLALVVAAALAPAGLGPRTVPAWAWALWASIFGAGLLLMRAAGLTAAQAVRRIAWLLPLVALFALPAALLAPSGRRLAVAGALAARALAATAAGAGLAARLGPLGLVRGAAALRVPRRLVDVLEAALGSLAGVLRQVRAMLRAREARRPSFGAFRALLREPGATVIGFGRFAGALLLRSLERAEALERARRARG
ncbi:MAG: hypothetical protein MUE47_06175, partial [Acidobacteria bacterium]|nr:hypothetical protein [Acidobacteriota bacterium]